MSIGTWCSSALLTVLASSQLPDFFRLKRRRHHSRAHVKKALAAPMSQCCQRIKKDTADHLGTDRTSRSCTVSPATDDRARGRRSASSIARARAAPCCGSVPVPAWERRAKNGVVGLLSLSLSLPLSLPSTEGLTGCCLHRKVEKMWY